MRPASEIRVFISNIGTIQNGAARLNALKKPIAVLVPDVLPVSAGGAFEALPGRPRPNGAERTAAVIGGWVVLRSSLKT